MNGKRETTVGRLERLAAQFAEPGQMPPEQRDEAREPEQARRPSNVRKEPFRRTVDLMPARHRELGERQAELATWLGVANVSGQCVLEELVTLYLTDELVARRLAARVKERIEGEQRDRETKRERKR
jgi:hypothetical protein